MCYDCRGLISSISFLFLPCSVDASQWSVGGMHAPLAFGAVVINIKGDGN